MNIDNLISLFSFVDDFSKIFLPKWQKHLLENGLKKRQRRCKMSPSEIVTILIHFHQMRFRNFKSYYKFYVETHMNHLFMNLVSYNRFVEITKDNLMFLCFISQSISGRKTGIYFVDSTILKSCHIKREKQNKVFKKIAKKAKSTLGWFFGFKLHLVINDKGEIMAFKLTAGNVDDRKPVPDLVKDLMGKLIGDKGYISKDLFSSLYNQGLQLVTKVKKNMKNKFMPIVDKILLRKRAVIETVNDQLKNICQIEHSRHRSVFNFATNILAAIVAYSLQPKKPSINVSSREMQLLSA